MHQQSDFYHVDDVIHRSQQSCVNIMFTNFSYINSDRQEKIKTYIKPFTGILTIHGIPPILQFI